MGIYRRVNRIVASRLHDLVDRLADPLCDLRQSVRELGIEIERLTQAAAESIASERLLAAGIAERQQTVDASRRKAAAAVRAGSIELARRLVGRQIDADTDLKRLHEQHEQVSSTNRRLRAQLDALQAQHSAARGNLESLLARLTAADVQQRAERILAGEAPLAWNRQATQFEAIVLHAEAKAAALAELNHGFDAPLAAELDAAERQERIEAELSRLADECAP